MLANTLLRRLYSMNDAYAPDCTVLALVYELDTLHVAHKHIMLVLTLRE